VDLGMVDGSQRSFKTLITVNAFLMLTMVFQEEVGLVTKGFICKRAMEAEPY
jgi:hypothetical protein